MLFGHFVVDVVLVVVFCFCLALCFCLFVCLVSLLLLLSFLILKLVTEKPWLHQLQGKMSAVDTNRAVDTWCHHQQKKMADACNVFMNTVRGALATAEAELVDDGIDKKKVQSALEEFRSLLRPISFRHFERPEEFRHTVGELYPTLQRQAMGWVKQFKRRMTPRCSVKHPWKVIVKEKLPKELFDMVEATVSGTSLGAISMKTQTNCVFTFTSHKEVRKLFSDLTDKSTQGHPTRI